MSRTLSPGAGQAGYRELIGDNKSFRLLWLGTITSLFGDWFNTLALYALVAHLTHSALALGLIFTVKQLAFALGSLPGGMIADRTHRKRLMIFCDLGRAAIVPCFLLIDTPAAVPLLFVIMAAQVVLGAIHDPAFRASIPNVCGPRELLTANALFAASWSTILAVGAALGGLAVAAIGFEAVILIDAGTYLVSALCISFATVPQTIAPPAPGSMLVAAYRDVREGFRYLLRHKFAGRAAVAKATWAVAGGGLLYLLARRGEAMTPEDITIGVGLLFSARGLGTGIGPIWARARLTDRSQWLKLTGLAVLITGMAYIGVGLVDGWFGLILLVIVAHVASGANWVLSTVLLQEQVEDTVRGRVFATEMVLLAIVEALSTTAASLALDAGWVDLSGALVIFGALQVVTGIAWVASPCPPAPKTGPPVNSSPEGT